MTTYVVNSAIAGANEEKLIVTITTSPDVNNVAYNNETATITIKYQAYQAKYSGDNQTLNRTGTWTGSTNFYMPATADTTVTIATETRTISLSQTSTTSVTIGGTITGHYGGASFSASQVVTFMQRPYGASQVSLSSTSFDMGTNVTINTNRVNTSFTHTIAWAFNGGSGTIGTGVGASTAWTFPIATLAPYLPNGTSGTGTITCTTYNGGTVVGTSQVTFTATVPASVIPAAPTVVVTDTSTALTIVGKQVKNISIPKINLTGCAGIQGSTISKLEIIYLGNTYVVTNGQSATSLYMTASNPISVSGNTTITGRVTDSRGRVSTTNYVLNVLAYNDPDIATFTVSRCNSSGVLDPVGTYLKVSTTGSVSSLVNITEKNTSSYTIYYKLRTAPTWTVLKATAAGTGLNVSYTGTLGTGNFSIASSYDVRVDITDQFRTAIGTVIVNTGSVTMSWNKTGIGVGKVWENGAVDAQGSIIATGGTFHSKHASGSNAGLFIKDSTSDTYRWSFVKTTTAESTGNVGSNLGIYRYSDAGAVLGTVLSADRASGRVTIPDLLATAFIDSGTVIGTVSGKGNYIKFSNGVLICWWNTSFTDQACNTAYGTAFTGTRTWTYPVAFLAGSSPAVTVGMFKWGTSASWGQVNSVGVTSADLRIYDLYSRATGTSTVLTVMAVGVWK